MIGIDLLDVPRLEQALARRPNLATRLFTERERAYAARRAQPAQHLAARFCAKEAVAKALELGVWGPHDIEVLSEGGAPRVELRGRAAETAADRRISVSLTHTATTAGAVAMVE